MHASGNVMLMMAGVFLVCVFSSGICHSEYTPGRTLADDAQGLQVKLVDGYAARHPRLLFGPEDKPKLQRRATAQAALWEQVIGQTRGLKAYVPDSEEVRTGSKYWRVPRMLSGALAYYVTGDESCKDAAVQWMLAHCKEDVWGTGYRSNMDLQASWYTYYICLAYDILYDDLTESERTAIRDGLVSHARVLYDSLAPPQDYRYDQNHTYIPSAALATAGLTLLGEAEDAELWLTRAYAIMRRCRYVLGEDGYYYEGQGYWNYALHWHMRYADLIARATGEPAHELPILRNNHLYALHITLPGAPFGYDVGDGGRGALGRSTSFSINQNTGLFRIASLFDDGAAMAVASRLAQMGDRVDDPSMYFLWRDDSVKAAPMQTLPTYHHFVDHDVVFWRSSWGEDATCYMFRCGPPQGHIAAGKLEQMDDWTMNSGHTHPDIGMFWIYAKGHYLAGDTGYTSRKWTDDHNTLLVDGTGQGVDGSYWVYRGWPYALFDAVRIEKVHLEDDYGYAQGDMSSAYPQDKLGKLSMKRHVLMAERYLLVLDALDAERAHTYSWLLHSDVEPVQKGDAFVSDMGGARLLTYVLMPSDRTVEIGPEIVMGGRSNPPGSSDTEQRGYVVTAANAKPARKLTFVSLLIPRSREEADPASVELSRLDDRMAEVTITWPGRETETISLDLSWQQGDAGGPANFAMSR